MLKKGDIVLVGCVIIIVFFAILGIKFYNNFTIGNNIKKVAIIKHNNKVFDTIEIDNVKKPYEIKITGEYNNVILVEKGRIRFLSADCPDKVCVNKGWLYKNGDIAICMPSKTIVEIRYEKINKNK